MEKVIFELKLNRKESLIAYEKRNYEEVYDDSFLVLKNKYRSTKLVESSFCYGFGAEMYYRIHNINEIESLKTFPTLLKDCVAYNSHIVNGEKEPNTFDNKYYFVGCGNKGLYLGKLNDKYVLLLVQFSGGYPNELKVKVTRTIDISANVFQTWQPIIKDEWERRAIIEGTRDNDISKNKEDWEPYFVKMRS